MLGIQKSHLNELLQFIKQIKKNVKRKFNIWIYTGDIYENVIQKESQLNILKECDVLVDGPYEQDKRNITLAFRGSENQRLIDLKKSFVTVLLVMFALFSVMANGGKEIPVQATEAPQAAPAPVVEEKVEEKSSGRNQRHNFFCF